MKLTVILGLLLVLLVLTDFADAQRRRNRGRRRGRGRGRGRNQCHLKEVEKCFDKLQALGKGPEPSEIIATGKGLDKLCSTIRQDTIKCAKNYMKKCGTPLHREIFDLFLDSITINFKLYCDPGPSREAFLKQSPCMHSKVLSQNDYKVACNNDYLAALEATEVDDIDESLDIMCCGYNRWEQCAIGKISDSCGAKGKEEFEKFVSKMLGGMTRRVCPADLFDPTSSSCTKVLPAKGTKPKGQKSDNAISKYVTSYGSFLFSVGQ